uniref:non-specific protein-tyrosine kinase n=1 Tax=Ciona intestinalis TaxID=7719 RepID=H2XZT8_CIOIN
VTRLSHFDFVKSEDLDKIGLGKPAQRRLWDTVKKAKLNLKKNRFGRKVLYIFEKLFKIMSSDEFLILFF